MRRCAKLIVVAALLAFAAVTSASAQAATRSKLAEVCTPEGQLAGQCRGPSGIAVNRTGAGGVAAGDFYVADTSNNRISEFSVTGSFVRAWGYDVVATGQDNIGATEQQTFTVSATGGKFWLEFDHSFTGTQAQGSWTNGSKTVTGVTTETGGGAHFNDFAVGDVVFSGQPGIPSGTTIAKVPPEVPNGTVELSQAATVNNGGNLFGLDIPYNVSAAVLESKLNALPSIGGVGGSVSVNRVETTPGEEFQYTVTFGGTLAGNDVPELGFEYILEGGGEFIEPEAGVPGGGLETCKAVSSPADTCKAGSESDIAGGLGNPQGVAVDQANGNVYVHDSSNRRVDVFSAIGAFEGAFGYAVKAGDSLTTGFDFCTTGTGCQAGRSAATAGGFASGGPSRTLAVDSSGNLYLPDSGNFRLNEFAPVLTGSTVTGASFVRAIGWDVVPAGATGTGTLNGTTTVSSVVTTSKAFFVGQTITSGSDIPAGTTITEVGSGTLKLSKAATGSGSLKPLTVAESAANVTTNEKQTLTVPATVGGGSFKLKFETPNPSPTSQTTAGIPYNAPASGAGSVQEALENLSNIGAGNVAVTGASGGPYTVEFKGTRFADTNVLQLIPDSTGLAAAIGTELSCSSTTTATTTSFQWLRNGTPITGATGATYTTSASSTTTPATTTGDAGATIQCQVFKFNATPVGSTQVSTPPMIVAPYPGTTPPTAPLSFTISGTVASGSTLTCPTTGWGGLPTFAAGTFQWYRNGVAIGGATNSTYVLTPGDVATPAVFQCAVTGTNAGGSVTKVSQNKATATPPSPVAPPSNTTSPAVSVPALTVAAATTVQGDAPALEVCTIASTCKQGVAGNGPGQFSSANPRGVAVDSGGNVYAVNYNDTCAAATPCRVEKFNPDGSFKENLGPASGECQLTYESGEGKNEAAIAVAVDPTNQHLLVLKKTSATAMKVCEFDSAGGQIGEIFPTAAMAASSQFNPGLAVGSAERVFATNGGSGGFPVSILGPPPPPPTAEVKPASEVTQTSAKLNGRVTVPAPGGPGSETAYRFEYSADNGLHWSAVPVPDEAVGSTAGPVRVSQKIAELQPNRSYRFRLRASDGGGSATSSDEVFTTTVAKPSISKTIALPVTGTTAQLNAAVNPNNSPTTYHFEWGPCASEATCPASPYPNRVPDFEAFVGGEGQPVVVSAKLSGLSLSSAYHFRLVATSAAGTTFGPDATFTTSAFEGVNEAGLPDNRAVELVSPPDKRPQGSVETFILDNVEIQFQAAADGDSVLFPILSGLGDTAAGGGVHYRAARNGSGWQSARVSPNSMVPGLGGSVIPSELIYATPDLSCQLLETFNPLTADTPSADVELGVTNLYFHKADDSYTLLSNAVPANPALPRSHNYYTVGGTSPDCGRVVFQTAYKLLPGTPSGIYEWDHGTLRDAGLRPDGNPASNASMGALEGSPGSFRSTSAVNAVGPDGRRLLFHATSNEGGDSGKPAVFVRKSLGVTIDASQKQGGAKESNGAYYQTASPDGSHLFFVANYGLTATPGAGWPTSCVYRPGSVGTQGSGGQGCDLYDYNVETEQLTDLSPDDNPADTQGAEVSGVVAASDDGSYVYFAARGRLVPGYGNTYAQNHAGAGFANIYLAHSGSLAFVATIRLADLSRHCAICGAAEGTGGGNLMVRADARSSQTTPDGHYLLFTSSANLTGYDSGGVEEAYLYSVASGSTTCVSCRPDGLPSVGAPPNPAGDPGTEPIRAALTEPEESYRIPRSLSADGNRIFFTMPDVLAPGAVSGKSNLYEWEQGQIYFLATFNKAKEGFQDAGASGDDVFVQSSDRLDPRYDIDTVADLYDFRVGGGFPDPPPPPVSCNVATSECQGPETSQPAGSSPASQSTSGAGNPPLPSARCPRGKVRRNGKCVSKSQHRKKHRKRHNRAANTDHGGAK